MSENTKEIKQLRAVRDSLNTQLSEIYAVAVSAKADPALRIMFEVRFERLNTIYENIAKIHSDIVTRVANLKEPNLDTEHEFLKNVDQMYFAAQATYRELFPPVQAQVQDSSTTNAPVAGVNAGSTTRLPKRNLRNFDGKLENWTSFIQVFTHSIHDNDSLANIEKFEYLVGCLSGEPLNRIKSIPLSDDNYIIAYKALMERYDNKRDLATYYWHQLHFLPKMKDESAIGLRTLCDNFNENLEALRALKIDDSLEDFLLLNALLDKLDPNTCRLFEAEIRDLKGEIPKLKQLRDFIDSQCRVLAAEQKASGQKSCNKINFRQRQVSAFVASSASTNNSTKCYICNNEHFVYSCTLLKSKTPEQRYKLIKDHRLCVNCLRPHALQACESKSTCRVCHKKHHTMLHLDSISSNNTVTQTDNTVNTTTDSCTSTELPKVNVSFVNALSTSISGNVALLSTALVDVRDSQGTPHVVRALLDSGSEASFITSKCARTLNLRGNGNRIRIQGVGANATIISTGSVLCQISARAASQVVISVDAHIIPQVSSVIPSQSLQPGAWGHIQNLNLADPEYYNSRHIDLLLGADVYAQILRPGTIISPDNHSPSALNTVFGWVLSGTVQTGKCDKVVQSFHTTIADISPEEDLALIMRQFWQVEEVSVTSNNSPEDDLCEKLFVGHYKRLSSGRFSVPLPFRDSPPILPKSKDIAIRRFYAIERRLKRDPVLQTMYVRFMQDYIEAGHMEHAVPIDSPYSFYLPHHCIFKTGLQATKIRVVFDASAKAANNLSLNDTLLIGPKLQNNIVDILLRFRLHNIVFVTDVQHMYRQIEVHPEFRDYQRIIWRFHPEDPLSEYILKTVTYGVSSAPFLALRTMQQLSIEGQDAYPMAAKVLLRDVYVDDIITGSDSVEQALELQTQLIGLLRSGGFPLRKWSSNHPALLESIPADHCQFSFSFDADPSLTIQVLGLQWTPSNDLFTYHFYELDLQCTKRGLLSQLARIFDPLGFLSPITFFIKRLIQSLWSLGIGWDDLPPSIILDQWSQYRQQVSKLSSLTIDRQLTPSDSATCQVHGFCDASTAGYAAVVFIRFESKGSYIVRLIMAKSKVAPPTSNSITIPRLELCGAVLLSKLLCLIQTVYADLLKIEDVYAWTDSSIVLSWIRSPAFRWKPYVANRVAYIQERVDPSNWHHVQSADNPADCASRGLLPSQLLNHSLWWSGPIWLQTDQAHWPGSNVDISQAGDTSLLEERRVQVLLVQSDHTLLNLLLDRFSSLRTVVHVTAYILRFVRNCKNALDHVQGPIDAQEYHATLLKLVKLVQGQVFDTEISKLKSTQLPSKPLRKLNLFLDENGVVRVGGRLRHSALAFEHKFPALLPKQHRLTSLIIEDTHRRHLHPGFRALHYLILQNFWILSPHRAIRKCLSQCHKCFRTNPRSLQPPMADLPAFRLQQLKPFSIIGVDFGGPFTITMNRVRGAKTLKAYLCLFVCCSTRALHLEIVSDLSTEAFLAALRRFLARRGRCIEVHSDCGTNFVGASRQLLEFGRQAAETELIQWKFNPPSASHFGGIWETGIRSVKLHLARVVGDQILTFEELHTIFVQVEAVLNSRPLCPISSDPNDLTALTPGHFLTLAPLTSFPEPNLTDLKIGRLTRWQMIQQMHQSFWKRWSHEFLHTLQQRAKWTNLSTPITIGSLVVIKDDLSPPLKWQLGRVIAIHPGSDGIIRVVTLQTKQGTLKRPVVKVCPLPLPEQS